MPLTPWDQLTLNARQGVYASSLPSNRALPNDVTLESLELGWTVQEPYAHVGCVVALNCVLCGESIDPRNWTRHECTVRSILERMSGPAQSCNDH